MIRQLFLIIFMCFTCVAIAQFGTVKSHSKISETQGGFGGVLAVGDWMGSYVTNLGDVDGDGVNDIATGSQYDDDGGPARGAVWIMFLDTAGKVKSEQKISDISGGFNGGLTNQDWFGVSVAGLGDLDNDNIPDMAVGVMGDDDGGDGHGAIWILFLNSNGTVKSEQKISDSVGGFNGILDDFDWFGQGLAGIGDLDNDGIPDLITSAPGDDDQITNSGALYVLFLNANGTVKGEQKISNTTGGFNGFLDGYDLLGTCITNLGDLNGDGVTDIAAGCYGSDDGGLGRGAIWIMFLNNKGLVIKQQKISDIIGGFTGVLDNYDGFGFGIGAVGDIDGDGKPDLAVGSYQDDDGLSGAGAVYILFMDSVGKVKSHQKISITSGNFSGPLDADDYFGSSLTGIGDLNKDGIPDVVVGTTHDDDGGLDKGALYILFLDGLSTDIPEISNTKLLDVYPNPCGTPCLIDLQAQLINQDNLNMTIFSLTGHVLIELTNIKFPTMLDLSPGMYLYRISSIDGRFYDGKLVVDNY